MAEVERMVFDLRREEKAEDTTYTMNHTSEGLRYRLVPNSGYDCPKHEVCVQHRPGSKIARYKQFRLCVECCCYSHCFINTHEKDVVSLRAVAGYPGEHVRLHDGQILGGA